MRYHRTMTADERHRFDELRQMMTHLYGALVTADQMAADLNPAYTRRYLSRSELRNGRQVDDKREDMVDS